MALNIQTQLTTREGLNVFPSYARIAYVVSHAGTDMSISVDYWVDETNFRNGTPNFNTKLRNLNVINVPFDRLTDGDPLVFAHNKAVEYLETQNIVAQIVLD